MSGKKKCDASHISTDFTLTRTQRQADEEQQLHVGCHTVSSIPERTAAVLKHAATTTQLAETHMTWHDSRGYVETTSCRILGGLRR